MVQVLFVFSACLTACMPYANRGVPEWAIHIKPPVLVPDISVTNYEKTLIKELQAPRIAAGYTPGEQIAVFAIEAVEANHGFDAAVLLAIASYRFAEQALFAVEQADRDVPRNVNMNVYRDLVKTEFKLYFDMHFDDEIEYLSSVLNHDEKRAEMIEQQRWELMGADASKQEHLYRKLLETIQSSYRAPVERLQYPALAEAFRERLIADVQTDSLLSDTASFYLAETPLFSFQLSALQHPHGYFSPSIARTVSQRLAVYGEVVKGNLAFPDPKVRSNAAVILGLSQDKNYVSLIEAAFQKESDPKARLSMLFALIWLEKETVDEVVGNISTCRNESVCEHAITLLHWLPDETKTGVSLDLIQSILSNKENSPLSRSLAALILRDLSKRVVLGPGHIHGLLLATEDDNKYVSMAATAAVGAMEKLDAKAILAYLSGSRGERALFLRWAAIALPEDLPALRRFVGNLNAYSEDEQVALIQAVGAVKGAASKEMLISLYRQRKDHRLLIAMILSERGDARHGELKALAELDDGLGALALKMAVDDSTAADAARRFLKSGHPAERVQTIQLSGHFARADLAGDIYRLGSFSDKHHYPVDALVRFNALSLVLWKAMLSADNLKDEPKEMYHEAPFRNGS